jgi:outer membrane protein OmpA-like peptidoglycan-associated protein
MRKSVWAVVVCAVVVALGVSGCATKKFVQERWRSPKSSDCQDRRGPEAGRSSTDDALEPQKSDAAQTEQIAKLSDTAKEALARAQEAGKLAKGKFLYEVTLTDEAVKFGFNKKDLSAEAKAALDAFAARLKSENKNVYIEIQGHTDAIGPRRQPSGRLAPVDDALPQHERWRCTASVISTASTAAATIRPLMARAEPPRDLVVLGDSRLHRVLRTPRPSRGVLFRCRESSPPGACLEHGIVEV